MLLLSRNDQQRIPGDASHYNQHLTPFWTLNNLMCIYLQSKMMFVPQVIHWLFLFEESDWIKALF